MHERHDTHNVDLLMYKYIFLMLVLLFLISHYQRELFCFPLAEIGPAVIDALFVLCRKMPCSGQRRHQSLRHPLSPLAVPPPMLPAVILLQAVQLFHLLAFLRHLSRRATTPMERPMLLVGKMMVTFSCKQGPNIYINDLFFYLAVKSLAFKKQNKIVMPQFVM